MRSSVTQALSRSVTYSQVLSSDLITLLASTETSLATQASGLARMEMNSTDEDL